MSSSDLKNGEVGLFPEMPTAGSEERTTGILPSQAIRELIAKGRIIGNRAITEEQIQPASLDLRLGDIAHRVQASFLPGPGGKVETKVKDLRMARVDLTSAAVFEKGCVYIVPLLEELDLPRDISGKANPKSTTGRLDVFIRLITDDGVEFERVPPGYKGRLYAEIVSRTFTVAVRAGMRLNQLRFVRGNPTFTDNLISNLDEQETLIYMDEENSAKARVDRGLKITVNLEASEPGEMVAYKARGHDPAIELDRIDYYSPEEFWEVRQQNANKDLILEPGDFYILASRERVRVPPDFAAEMVPFDPSVGEFRIHYAGFFDPGFGYGTSDIKGTPAVLEVRAHEVPFLMEHGQFVRRLTYMPLLSRPDKIYGLQIRSVYQRAALAVRQT